MAKKTDIWMPVYIGDLLADTMHLTPTEFGAYHFILYHLWLKGEIPERQLRAVTRLSAEMWTESELTLKGFLSLDDAGNWTQKRVDAEKKKADAMSASNSANGKLGGRPKKPNNPNESETKAKANPNESETEPKAKANGKPNETPSQSQLQLQEQEQDQEQDQKPYRGKRDTDLRHVPFKLACQTYAKHKGATFVWDGSDAKQLGLLLAAAPELTIEGFQRCLNNRARSPAVLHGDRPRMYLGTILSFQQSAVNQFKQPEGTGNGQQKGKSGQTVDAGRDFLKGFADRLGLGEDGNPPASAESVAGGLRSLRGGSFALPLG